MSNIYLPSLIMYKNLNLTTGQITEFKGPCPDSMAVMKESSFFQVGKRGRKERGGRGYCTVVDLELSILAALDCCQHNK